MEKLFTKTTALTDKPFHYCPGCTHGIIHRLVAESIEELGLKDKAIGLAPVGCAVFANEYFNVDMQTTSHGRSPAIATGIKRALPDRIVFTYQGDGDLASIGCGEVNHAAVRGEKITTIFINNAIYGMTGGQAAPTTLLGQKTTTTPYGKDGDANGYPMKVCEMLAAHEGAYYLERVALWDTAHIIKAKKAIKKAFQYQAEGKGYCLVEVLGTCPTNWGCSPLEAFEWQKENMLPMYPLGVFKDKGGEE